MLRNKQLFWFCLVLVGCVVMVGRLAAAPQGVNRYVAPTGSNKCVDVATCGNRQPDASLSLVNQIGGEVQAVSVQGNIAYVGIGPRLVILDISNPVSPQRIGQSDLLPGRIFRLAINGNYAYATTGYAGVTVINISNAAAPPSSSLPSTSLPHPPPLPPTMPPHPPSLSRFPPSINPRNSVPPLTPHPPSPTTPPPPRLLPRPMPYPAAASPPTLSPQ